MSVGSSLHRRGAGTANNLDSIERQLGRPRSEGGAGCLAAKEHRGHTHAHNVSTDRHIVLMGLYGEGTGMACVCVRVWVSVCARVSD